MKIIIDPGHSGAVEPGACAGGIKECDVVLLIAKLLGELLYDAGHAVLFTRTGEITTTDLQFRAELANANEAELFISIHANSVSNPAAHGSEVYHYPGSRVGRQLASFIQSHLVAELGTVDRGVKAADFAVLRETMCPAVLVEAAFLSNERERNILASYTGQLAVAQAIFQGVYSFMSR